MANVKANGAKTASKSELKVTERHQLIFLSQVVTKKNSNDKPFISTPKGAVYANLDKVEAGLNRIVTLSDGKDQSMLALHKASSPDDVLEFINSKMEQFPNMSEESIRAQYGL